MMKVTLLLHGIRIGGEGGEITAHKYVVPFISCSMHVQLIMILKSP